MSKGRRKHSPAFTAMRQPQLENGASGTWTRKYSELRPGELALEADRSTSRGCPLDMRLRVLPR